MGRPCDQARYFSCSPRLIVPDQRGHGESERPQTGYTLDEFALDAIALLDKLGIASVCVIGHCLGGLVAQRMASLATAASADNEVIRSMRPEVESLTDPVSTEFIRAFQRSTIHRPVSHEFFEGIVKDRVSVFWGNRDTIFSRAEQTELLARIPAAHFHTFPDVGHALHWEAPDELLICEEISSTARFGYSRASRCK
jgi:pimeloyl-ACP methyl ester carboxylesterase